MSGQRREHDGKSNVIPHDIFVYLFSCFSEGSLNIVCCLGRSLQKDQPVLKNNCAPYISVYVTLLHKS